MKNDIDRHTAVQSHLAGFGLVETMVAVAIGLLATFIIMQIFATSESQKRTITGSADAQSDAAVTLYLIERDLRQAGYGLSPNAEDFGFAPPPPNFALNSGILGQCTTVRAYNANRATTPDFVYASDTFAPVVINPPGYPAGDANTDVILVTYGGTGGMIGKGTPLNPQDGATNQAGGDVPDYIVNTDANTGDPQGRAAFAQGDMVLAVPPPGTGLDCTLGEVTGLPLAAPLPSGDNCAIEGDTARIYHNSVSYPSRYVADCGTVGAAWNEPGAGITYNAGSRLYNLGPVGAFVSRVYAVRKGNLTMCDLTSNDCTTDPPVDTAWPPIAAGVVGLKAQYGKDSDFDGLVNVWNTDQPAGPARAQVVALRLAVVVRSGQYEKESVTTAAPVWHQDAVGTANANIDISASRTDWQRYRYRAAQSVVPLRNMIWGQQR